MLVTLLLIGSDSRGSDQGRSDSFIIVHISADCKSVYLVSFPRNTWGTVPGYGTAPVDPAGGQERGRASPPRARS
jgi:anionic cell wall polymer biosynthesis LytR-Cps2A-Psr (LCP) family protein